MNLNHRGEHHTFTQGSTFEAGRFKNIPCLDATSVASEDGRTVYVNVINRHETDAIAATISDAAGSGFADKATVRSIEGTERCL